MLTEHELEKLAEVLWWGLSTARREKPRKGDIILVRYHLGAVRLAEILYRRILERGIHPLVRMNPTPDMEQSLYREATAGQLDFIAPGEERLARALGGTIFLNAPESLTHLGAAAPGKIGRVAKAQRPLRKVLERREARGCYSWTLCVLPTAGLSRHAGLTPEEYARQVASACFLDSTDPVAEWRKVHRRTRRVRRWLEGLAIRSLHVESAGTDMWVELGDRRRWAGISGRNIPSFEIFVSPDWRGTRGVFQSDQPSFRSGNLVRGARFEFRRGQVAAVAAEAGEAFLKTQLALDAGAVRLGEFSLTDRRLSRIDRFMAQTLYDENFGGAHGNCHIALGSSYSNTYAGDPSRLSPALKQKLGFNDSALHWDFVNTEKKRVTAVLSDGSRQVVYEDGEFRCA